MLAIWVTVLVSVVTLLFGIVLGFCLSKLFKKRKYETLVTEGSPGSAAEDSLTTEDAMAAKEPPRADLGRGLSANNRNKESVAPARPPSTFTSRLEIQPTPAIRADTTSSSSLMKTIESQEII